MATREEARWGCAITGCARPATVSVSLKLQDEGWLLDVLVNLCDVHAGDVINEMPSGYYLAAETPSEG